MTDPEFRIERSPAGLARVAVEAAAPILAEAAASKILAHMQAHGPEAGTPLGGTLRRAWRRYLHIAAQVASFAFDTEDDMRRKAAAAIGRGDFVVCTETPSEETP